MGADRKHRGDIGARGYLVGNNHGSKSLRSLFDRSDFNTGLTGNRGKKKSTVIMLEAQKI